MIAAIKKDNVYLYVYLLNIKILPRLKVLVTLIAVTNGSYIDKNEQQISNLQTNMDIEYSIILLSRAIDKQIRNQISSLHYTMGSSIGRAAQTLVRSYFINIGVTYSFIYSLLD